MPVIRNRVTAFFMNFLPGLGHLYWGKKIRCFFYMLFFCGFLLGGFSLALLSNHGEPFVFGIVCAAIVWGVSMFDLFIVLLRDYPGQGNHTGYAHSAELSGRQDAERFFTILLSFVPGLGHFYMGLMQRGLSFLVAFFGTITMLIFVAGITNDSVLVFLCVLPVIWLYCMFDAVQCIHRKLSGEILTDRTLFSDWEISRENGRRSKFIATLLSVIPGVGQMYLGLQRRGIQLMILFLGTFYIIDVIRLSLFLFLLPLIWFFSFFDGLQLTSRYGREPLIDKPLVEGLGNHKRLLGTVLLLLGLYYVSMNLIVPYLASHYPGLWIESRINKYLKPFIVSVVLIGGGLKLLTGTKRKPSGVQVERRNFDEDRF